VDFAFTAEQEELIRTLRGFARKELAVRSQHWDKSGEFPSSAWRQMGELGLLGLRAPVEYGGQEADLLTTGIAMEEIARGDFSCTYALQLAGLAGEIIGKNGADEVKKRWLPGIISGETVVAIALTEPSVGSDAANLVCRAARDGDEYVITGEKSGISLGQGPGRDRLRRAARCAGREPKPAPRSRLALDRPGGSLVRSRPHSRVASSR